MSQLSVGKTGAAFILGRGGSMVAAPDPDADETNMQRSDQPLLPVAQGAFKAAGGSDESDKKTARQVRFVAGADAYAVTLTPLAFPGWTLATVIPEAEFLGPIETTIRRLLVGLAILILAAGALSAWLARRIIAAPLIAVTDELKHVERFELDQVRRRPSRIAELENLSNAIADMAGGLAAFRKYIPADLVKTLLSEGVEPRPGGSIRTVTILFADIAGFTGLSERLGDQIVPLLSGYLDLMSREVSGHGGTIDKFIGDAVMAFWGAPAANADHAVDACRAALACAAGAAPIGTVRRRRPAAQGAHRHQFRRGSGRQYRLGVPPQLHRDRRRRERGEPPRRRQQGIRHRHHHRRGDAPPRRRPHRGARSSTGSRSTGARAGWRSTNCSVSPKAQPTRRAGLHSTSAASPPIARATSPGRRICSSRSWPRGRRMSPRVSCSPAAASFSTRLPEKTGKRRTR